MKKGAQLKRHIDATLGSGNLQEAVRLPIGEKEEEWLAVNTVDFFNAISVLYGALEEFCTETTCPVMRAGKKVLIDFHNYILLKIIIYNLKIHF